MAWLEQVAQPSQQVVYCIKATQKGYILKTVEYDLFLWADSKLGVQIAQALEFWAKNENLGVELVITPDKHTKLGYRVTPGKSVTYFTQGNSWTTEEPEEEDLVNPFLGATPFATPQAHPIPANGHARAKAKKQAKDLMNNLLSEDPTKP